MVIIEVIYCQGEVYVFIGQMVGYWNVVVFKCDDVCWLGILVYFFFICVKVEIGCVFFDYDGGNIFGIIIIGVVYYDVIVRCICVGNECFGVVEYVMIVIMFGFGVQVGSVRIGIWFGQVIRCDFVYCYYVWQEMLVLFFIVLGVDYLCIYIVD